jgi:arylsulfatase A
VRATITFCLLACLTAVCAAAAGPNIVIILADDLGYGDPQCYNAESKIPTPHIDRLAQRGVRFTDAHSPSAVCTPTRYSLLTGRYCWRSRLKRSVLWSYAMPLIEPGRLTLPEMLRTKGYATGCIGKWHLGMKWARTDGKETPPVAVRVPGKVIDLKKPVTAGPLTAGFDSYFGTAVPNFPPYCFIENDHVFGRLPDQPKPAGMFGAPGRMQDGWKLENILPGLSERAVAFIGKHGRTFKATGKPFFLYFPLTAPHTPISPAAAYRGKSGAAAYGDFVHQVDATVGAAVAAVDRLGLAKDTLIIFTSDNGSPARNGTNASGPVGSVIRDTGHRPSGKLRGLKGDIHEGGHRVPFVARWRGTIPAGRVSGELICHVDLMAAIASLVGVDLPEDAAEDSFDILPALKGETLKKPIRKAVIHHSFNGTFAIRHGEWKLITGKGSGGFTRIRPGPDAPAGQLYHVGNDPAEKDNVYTKHPDVVSKLTSLLEQFKADGHTRP